MQKLQRVGRYYRRYGFMATAARATQALSPFSRYREQRWYKAHCPTTDELEKQRAETFAQPLLFSILVPVYNTKASYLLEMAQSFLAQSYPQWEACLYDGASTRAETKAALKQIAELDPRFHVQFGTNNDGISGNSNHALAMAQGDYTALCDHDDLYAPDALYCFRKAIDATQAELLYSDEDKINDKGTRHFAPHFKPDFAPDSLRSGNYICHLLVLKRSLMQSIGGWKRGFDGSQDHELTLRASEQAAGIAHIPRVLYHWRMISSSASHQALERCVQAAQRAVQEQTERLALPCEVGLEEGLLHVQYQTPQEPCVAAIVYGERPADCIASLRRCDPQIRWEILTVEQTDFASLDRAARQAKSPYLLFIDSQIRAANENFARELLMFAQRDDVGAATPMIEDMHQRVLHMGYVLGELPRSRGMGHYRCFANYMQAAYIAVNVSGGSRRAMMIRKDHYLQAGGFDLAYAQAWADVALCRQFRWNVFTPYAEAQTVIPLRQAELLFGGNEADNAVYRQKNTKPVQDAFYNPNFTRETADFRW